MSPDGIRWQRNVDGRPWRPGGNGTNVLGWEPAAGKYVVYIRMYPPGSSPEESQISIFRSTSDHFLQWSEPELVLAPERDDLDYKGFPAMIYEHYYVASTCARRTCTRSGFNPTAPARLGRRLTMPELNIRPRWADALT